MNITGQYWQMVRQLLTILGNDVCYTMCMYVNLQICSGTFCLYLLVYPACDNSSHMTHVSVFSGLESLWLFGVLRVHRYSASTWDNHLMCLYWHRDHCCNVHTFLCIDGVTIASAVDCSNDEICKSRLYSVYTLLCFYEVCLQHNHLLWLRPQHIPLFCNMT